MHFWETHSVPIWLFLCNLTGKFEHRGEHVQVSQITARTCICTQKLPNCMSNWVQKCFLVSAYNSLGIKSVLFTSLYGEEKCLLATGSLKMLHLPEGRRFLENPVLISTDEIQEIQGNTSFKNWHSYVLAFGAMLSVWILHWLLTL